MMMQKSPLCMIAYVLMVVGALNWGLVGFFEWNLVDALLGSWPVVVRVVYALVGLAGVYSLVGMFMHCKECKDCK